LFFIPHPDITLVSLTIDGQAKVKLYVYKLKKNLLLKGLQAETGVVGSGQVGGYVVTGDGTSYPI